MLGKLLKYEMISSVKTFLPFYLATIAFSLLNLLLAPTYNDNTFFIVSLAMYSITIALSVVTLLAIINRFKKNLLGREGYLMFTLPVSIDTHIMAKCLSAVIWSLFTGIIITIIVFLWKIAAERYGFEFIGFFESAIDQVVLFFDSPKNVVVVSLSCLSSLLSFILLVYLVHTIGHLVTKHRNLAVMGLFFIISILVSLLTAMITERVGLSEFYYELDSTGIRHYLLQACINIIWSVVYFMGTYYILKNKLNLE